MKHFYVIPNYSKENTYACAVRIRSFLMEHGADCGISPEGPERKEGRPYHDASLVPADAECLIILGGDGTIIQAVHDLGCPQIPVVGINLGHIGYLAEVDEPQMFTALGNLLRDDYFIERRMTLQGEVIRNGEVIHRDTAFNDIILTRRRIQRMANFSLYVDGQFLNRYAADGMIVATPTGSTAYSLSAGGPIVMPSSYLFVLTPVCPHEVAISRSIVLPPESVIELAVEERADNASSIECVDYDAHTSVPLCPQDRIRITCGKNDVKMIRLSRGSFLETLRKKLGSGRG